MMAMRRSRTLIEWLMRPHGVDKQPVQCKAPVVGTQTQLQPLYAAAGLRALLQINHADACVISTAAAVFRQPCTSIWGPAAGETHDLDPANALEPASEAAPSQLHVAVTASPTTSNVKLLASLFESSKGMQQQGSSARACQVPTLHVAAGADAAVLVTLARDLEKAPSVRELLQAWESRSAAHPCCSLSRTSSSSSSSSWSSGSSSLGESRPSAEPRLRSVTAAAAPGPSSQACAGSTTHTPSQQQQCSQEQEPQLPTVHQLTAGTVNMEQQQATPRGWRNMTSVMVCSVVSLCMLTG